jgi:anti-anti-sigma factor
MESTFELESSRRPGAAVLTLRGELDIASAPVLVEGALRCIGQGHDRLVLDLAEVTFLDSSGINAIVRVLRSAEAHGGRLALARPTRQARRVFELTSFDRFVAVRDTVAEAVAALDEPVAVTEVLARSTPAAAVADDIA